MTFRWTGTHEELFSHMPIEWLRWLGAPTLDGDEFQIVEASGSPLEALLADYLDHLLTQWRDYGFVAARIDVVQLLSDRIGTQVFGAYQSPHFTYPLGLPKRINAAFVQIGSAESAQSADSVLLRLDMPDHR